jgi:hypothetical protein
LDCASSEPCSPTRCSPAICAYQQKLARLCVDHGASVVEAALQQCQAVPPATPAPRVDHTSAGDVTSSDGIAIGPHAQASVDKRTHGQVKLHDSRASIVVGVSSGTINAFFGAQPPANAKELLDTYLEMLVAIYDPLQLGRLLGKAQTGPIKGGLGRHMFGQHVADFLRHRSNFWLLWC